MAVADRSVFARSDLQVVLRWTLNKVTPTKLSLSEWRTAGPETTAFTIECSVRQCWACKSSPLTICTESTLLSNTTAAGRVRMAAIDHTRTPILVCNNRPYRVHYIDQEYGVQDLREKLSFATIPPGNEAVTVSRAVTWRDVRRLGIDPIAPDKIPLPGDLYNLCLVAGYARKHYIWWNWGDLEGDLKGKTFKNSHDRESAPDNEMASYGYGSKRSDFEHNHLIHLLIHMDTTPQVMEFID